MIPYETSEKRAEESCTAADQRDWKLEIQY